MFLISLVPDVDDPLIWLASERPLTKEGLWHLLQTARKAVGAEPGYQGIRSSSSRSWPREESITSEPTSPFVWMSPVTTSTDSFHPAAARYKLL